MIFSSSLFLFLFLPLFLLAYYFADKKYKNTIILLFSIIFYAWGAPNFVYILLGSTFVDFYLVKWMSTQLDGKKKKTILFVSIFINLGLLLYFKYANFFIGNVNSSLSSFGLTEVGWTKVALPIGISFYTFQTLTYSIDVYRNIHQPLKKVSNYLLYIIMFPQLIAGPIVRFTHIADQLTDRKETAEKRFDGFLRFCLGLGKKILIANVMAKAISGSFSLDAIALLNSTDAWIVITAYAMQIYFHFSGYSDMAIGLGKMMGFEFPENFNNPYVSKSITEFWRRWHITLGIWMRDYLYIPLGGNRSSNKFRVYFNLWIVFLISGMWHGDSWNFIIWGAFHGFFLVIDKMFLIKALNKSGAFVSTFITFFLILNSWVFFAIDDISTCLLFFSKLYSFDFGASKFLYENSIFWTLLSFAILFSFFTTLNVGAKIQAFFFENKGRGIVAYSALFTTGLSLLFISGCYILSGQFNPFIYFRF
jgi:alginate O-acetyltransferase complex protein AlgI